jgi:drug/metabolite transporter (DMT)-like permease
VSALRIGANSEPQDDMKGRIDSIAKWIPGEVLAFYVAAIAALRGTMEPLEGQKEVLPSQSTPGSGWLLLGAIVMTVALTVVGAIRGGENEKPKPAQRKDAGLVFVLVLLAVIAFLVWSLTIPQTWWTDRGLKTAIAVIAVAGFSIVYVPIAELIAGWVRPKIGQP